MLNIGREGFKDWPADLLLLRAHLILTSSITSGVYFSKQIDSNSSDIPMAPSIAKMRTNQESQEVVPCETCGFMVLRGCPCPNCGMVCA